MATIDVLWKLFCSGSVKQAKRTYNLLYRRYHITNRRIALCDKTLISTSNDIVKFMYLLSLYVVDQQNKNNFIQ